MKKAASGTIRVGVGGWNYAPWRGPFYPAGLLQKRELEFASRQLTSIEINSTFYGAQKRQSFERWYEETPENFVFSVKAPRYVTKRGVLAEAGKTIDKFLTSGVTALQQKLGPINWQFAPEKAFDATDFEAFLKLLPPRADDLTLKHAVEVRHASFGDPEFIALARRYQVAIVMAFDSEYPLLEDITGPFVYARVMGTQASEKLGYSPKALDRWAERARSWVSSNAAARAKRDVYLYFISGNKVVNPAAAIALVKRMDKTPFNAP